MKKLSAFILLFALAALFVEAAKLPPGCNKKTVSKCTVMMKVHSNCKMMAEMMKKHQQKKGKCNSRTCPDCPLFTVTTFKAAFGFIIPKPVNKIECAVMLNNDLSEYHSQQWKPPNTFPG